MEKAGFKSINSARACPLRLSLDSELDLVWREAGRGPPVLTVCSRTGRAHFPAPQPVSLWVPQ